MTAERPPWHSVHPEASPYTRKTGRFVTPNPSLTEAVLADIGEERERQFAKWGPQHHPDGTDVRYSSWRDAMRASCGHAAAQGRVTWYHIAYEEFTEALAETDDVALRKELVQAAAVFAAWIEDIDSRHKHDFSPKVTYYDIVLDNACPCGKRPIDLFRAICAIGVEG
jgi:hypothetical protein